MITLPIILPLLPLYGFDPLWLGVLYAVNTQTGYLTPPFGTMLFMMKGIVLVPPKLNFHSWGDELEEIGDKLNVNVKVEMAK